MKRASRSRARNDDHRPLRAQLPTSTRASPLDEPALAAPTFKVTCCVCNVDDSLLYPRSEGTYVCPDCEESAVARAWARRGILQWLALALAVVALVAASALAFWRLAPPGQHDPVMPYQPAE